MGHLIGIEHFVADDWLPKLPVYRAKFWRDKLANLHVAQLVLTAKLNDRLHFNDDDEGTVYKRIVSSVLLRKARLLATLDMAVALDMPVVWTLTNCQDEKE